MKDSPNKKIQKIRNAIRKNKWLKIIFFSIPFFLVLLLVILQIVSSQLQKDLSRILLLPKPLEFSKSLYPQFQSKSFSSDTSTFQSIDSSFLSAQAAIVMDDESKVILLAKNENLRFSMASTTKIMTALTALEYFALSDTLIIFQEKVVGAHVGFAEREEFSFEDLLYALLLPSGNDAALAIAQNYPGGEEAFITKMNEKAQELHLYNTHFADSSGLMDEGDYTTAIDLARLGSEALRNETFSRIVSTKHKTIKAKNTKNSYELYNLNKLLGSYNVTGIKTGFTDEAGEVLVTSQKEGDHTLIIVIMKSENRFADTEKILSLISGNIEYLDLENK